MTPQHSNRQALIDGALHCVEESPSPQITARQIASAANANLASIGYHFGSTEALLGAAMAEGFRRWLGELGTEMGDVAKLPPSERIWRASDLIMDSMDRHKGLVRAFFSAIARAPHDETLRSTLADSYRESRTEIASLLELGDDDDAIHAARLVLATFDGLLIQAALSTPDELNAENLKLGLLRLAMATQPSDQL